MKIIVPEIQTCLRTMFNFLEYNVALDDDVIYSSTFDPNVYVWKSAGSSRYYIYLDSELDVFSNRDDAVNWIVDNDMERVFMSLEVTDLKAVLTIS